jgi:hypothetical protein
MPISREEAREYCLKADEPQLLRIIKNGLQQFIDATAKSGFRLPLTVELRDAHDALLREFIVARGGKIILGETADAVALYILPLTATATDPRGRVAVTKIDAERVEAKFLN